MERRADEITRIIASAIYDGMRSRKSDAAMNPCPRQSSAYVAGEPAPHAKTSIDGTFYLMAVARAVTRRLSSEGVLDLDR